MLTCTYASLVNVSAFTLCTVDPYASNYFTVGTSSWQPWEARQYLPIIQLIFRASRKEAIAIKGASWHLDLLAVHL